MTRRSEPPARPTSSRPKPTSSRSPFDAAAARAFGQVASDLRTAGRTTKARAYDALIAAIAVAQQLPIYTVNPRDFEHIADLELVAIPHPDTASDSEPVE